MLRYKIPACVGGYTRIILHKAVIPCRLGFRACAASNDTTVNTQLPNSKANGAEVVTHALTPVGFKGFTAGLEVSGTETCFSPP